MAEEAPPPVVMRGERESGGRQPVKPKLIEIPTTANAARTEPLTIFILNDGQLVETRRFLLTVRRLSVSVDRQERSFPIDMLNIDATRAANRERGIELRIPTERNEISLSF